MRYLALLAYEPTAWSEASEETRQAYHQAHLDFHKAVAERATLLAGEALADVDTATTMRHVDGQVALTEGPFAETVEQIGGFYLVDAPNLDVMTDLCALLPPAYTIEIRPVITIEGFES